MPNISIVTPVCGYNGKGAQFLNDLLRTIEIQTFSDFEVVISDHSEDDELIGTVKEFESKFEINYFKNINQRGNSPANLNYALSKAKGEIIKPMFQDDFFYDDEALEKIYYTLSGDNKQWMLCGTNHTKDHGNSFFWELFPRFNDNLLEGVNTISSPSVAAWKKDTQVQFDESLVYLMDLDFYYAMRETYGDPIYYDDVLVSNRIHQDSISNSILDKETLMQKESNYCKKKYGML